MSNVKRQQRSVILIFNIPHFHVTACVLYHIYCQISLKLQQEEYLLEQMICTKVLFNQTSHWPLERKPNNSDDNEVPLATNKIQSVPALFVISNWTECGKKKCVLMGRDFKKDLNHFLLKQFSWFVCCILYLQNVIIRINLRACMLLLNAQRFVWAACFDVLQLITHLPAICF